MGLYSLIGLGSPSISLRTASVAQRAEMCETERVQFRRGSFNHSVRFPKWMVGPSAQPMGFNEFAKRAFARLWVFVIALESGGAGLCCSSYITIYRLLFPTCVHVG